jgi:hypothetical protein
LTTGAYESLTSAGDVGARRSWAKAPGATATTVKMAEAKIVLSSGRRRIMGRFRFRGRHIEA